MGKKDGLDETKRLLEWIKDNPNAWKAIHYTDSIKVQEYIEILEILTNESFYHQAIIFLLCFNENRNVGRYNLRAAISLIMELWEEGVVEKFFRNSIEELKRACELGEIDGESWIEK